MLVQNPFTKHTFEYPIELLNLNRYEYHIAHETPFTDRRSEWSVTILGNADTIYIPAGSNRCRDIYIVTWEYTSGQAQFPYGIYKIPMASFIS